MKYKLAFDVYGTLIDTSGVFETLNNLVGKDAKMFMDTWRSKQLEYSFRRGLMNRHVDFTVCTKDALEFCCRSFKVELSEMEKGALMMNYTVLPAFPDVKEGLESLRKDGHKLYAFSNGSSSAVSNLLIHAGLIELFDGVVSVEDVSMFKPSPLVYQHFNETTNSKKSNSYLISSNPFDVIGAVEYGMKSAWIQRTPDAIFDPWGVEPTEIVNSLTELSKTLR